MEPSILFQQLGLALLLGLLVGLQRQRSNGEMAGMRTFPLIAVLGTVAAVLGHAFGAWMVPAGLLALVGVLVFPNLMRLRRPEPDPGITTDVAVLLMYAVGALLTLEHMMPVAIAVGGGVAVLLQYKPEMHRFAARLGDADLRAIMQFVVITCIVLPVLPNRTFGPLDVFNPFKTWLMVVLIVGLELGGYIAYKFLGRETGILLGGIVGGAVSSTATTVSYSRRCREDPTLVRASAVVIMIASTVVFARVLILIAVVAWDFLPRTIAPLLVLMLLTLVPSLALWRRVRREPPQIPEQQNPTDLKSAVFFAVLFALVLFALAAAERYAGGQTLYAVAALSGMPDMDAITLSTAQMSRTDPHILQEGWRLILVAALANLVVKATLVGILGNRRLLGLIVALFALPMLGGLAMVFFWPG